MPFTMQCQNKGCCKMQEPYLDKDTDKVYCSACNNEIKEATHFAKMQMKALKQYRQKESKSFSVKCEHCKNDDRPIPGKDKKSYFCSVCKKELNLSQAFKKMLDERLKSADKEI